MGWRMLPSRRRAPGRGKTCLPAGVGCANFTAVTAAVAQVDQNTLITDAGGNTIAPENVSKSSLFFQRGAAQPLPTVAVQASTPGNGIPRSTMGRNGRTAGAQRIGSAGHRE